MRTWRANLKKFFRDFYQKRGIYTGQPVDLLFVRRIEWHYVIKYLQPHWADRICDIACGNGNFTKRMRQYAHQVVGIDTNGKALQTAVKTVTEAGTHFLLSRAETVPFPDGSFDKIFSICAFEHFDDDTVAFQEAARILKKGGKAVFTVASLSSRFGLQGSPLEMHKEKSDIKRTYSMPEFARRLEGLGFAVERDIYIIRTRLTGWMFRRMVSRGYDQGLWSTILLPITGRIARWVDACALHRNEGNILIVHCVKK